MSVIKKTVGVSVAAAAATMFIAGVGMNTANAAAHSKKADVKCMGVNSCKGHGQCKTAENACKGMNVCKGHGWVSVKSAKACADKGGTVAN